MGGVSSMENRNSHARGNVELGGMAEIPIPRCPRDSPPRINGVSTPVATSEPLNRVLREEKGRSPRAK